MSTCRVVTRPLAQCLRQAPASGPAATIRLLSTTGRRHQDLTTSSSSSSNPPPPPSTLTGEINPLDLDPNTAVDRWAEAQLAKLGTPAVGSRRRRSALRTSQGIPFEQLPYQCFQEARRILAADREAKIAAIVAETDKISALEALDESEVQGRERIRQLRLAGLRRQVEKLKILADINDPMVKRRFEDGLGDLNKPIYRYLADRKWRAYDRKVIAQRISQFHIVPDVLPKLEPTADVQLFFRRRARIPPGQIVDSLVSEAAPRLRVSVFDRPGERLVSIVVLDADVPNLDTDSFSKRCHFLAANIPVQPVQDGVSIPLGRIHGADQLAIPWLPPSVLKGSPYHRLAIFVLEQKSGEKVDVDKLKELYAARDGFSLKSFRDKFALTPVGFNMFRSVWDENTAAVMERAGIPGADLEFRRKHAASLKPPKKARGWEAKRQGPKYRHLWKYTKRIRGLSNARGWIKK